MSSAASAPVPPVAARRPVTRTHHGHTFIDDYEWMRDTDSPEVRAHLEAENAFTEARTRRLEPLREAIFSEIVARTRLTDMTVPARLGDWWLFSRSAEGLDYRIHVRVSASPGDWTPPEIDPEAAGEDEQVLLDCNAEAAGAGFFSLGALSFSADGRYLAWAADTTGDELFTLRIRDLATGEDLPEEIERTFAGAEIDPRGEWVYYTTADEAWRPHRLWRHRIGTAPAEDELLLEEDDESFWLGFDLSRSGDLLLISSQSKNTSEWWTLDLREEPAGSAGTAPRQVWPRVSGVEYAVEHWRDGRSAAPGGDRLLITHNRDRRDFSITEVPLSDPTAPGTSVAEELWRDPASGGARIEGVDAFAGFLAVSCRLGGFARVAVLARDSGARASEASGGWGTVREAGAEGLRELTGQGADETAALGTTALGRNLAWEQPHVRISHESFVEPHSIVDVEVPGGEARLRRRQEVRGGVDLSAYAQRLDWASAADGARIPVSLVWKPGARAGEGPAPTVLYGYGAYEASMDPHFSVARLSLLDRGAVWAVAHVRGGGEMGRGWYEAGRLEHKQNTFSDFAAVARHLIGTGLTEPSRLAALGGSAGGLLMGAVANQAPELFAGIVADVPFVDPLTSILMPELPLTVVEWDEWGDPLHDPEAYARIRAYSPYENVARQDYPRILAVTSLHDTRVLCVEPAKWTARLREVGADVLLKTEMSAGHGGVSGRYGAWRDTAFEFAWLLDAIGVEPDGTEPNDA
ncbi:S9 family peptidase [Brevibacterium album]|uniref:S9 family peptidase n=1 Tax=Brevibacterium album TaxID=417948 RepID=UPI0004209336|nr:S9 family peptidase [Brevibacterium album]